MARAVLDASALIALLADEPGADLVREHLREAIVSSVNYGEVLKKTIERGGKLDEAVALIRGTMLQIIDFSANHAVIAASLYPQTKHLGLSFADRACLALGVELRSLVLTTEQKMHKAVSGLEVKLVRAATRKKQ